MIKGMSQFSNHQQNNKITKETLRRRRWNTKIFFWARSKISNSFDLNKK
jgi:hypothetical protein